MAGRVIIKINPKTGERTIEVDGVEGRSCEEITEALERGNEVQAKQYTEEYDIPDLLPQYIEDL